VGWFKTLLKVHKRENLVGSNFYCKWCPCCCCTFAVAGIPPAATYTAVAGFTAFDIRMPYKIMDLFKLCLR